MKIGDVKPGVRYAIRYGKWGPFSCAEMLRVETVEVEVVRFRPARKVKVALMMLKEGSYTPSRRSDIPRRVPGAGPSKRYVPARDIHLPWDEHLAGERARAAYVAKAEEEEDAISIRFADLKERFEVLGLSGELGRSNRFDRDSQCLIEMNALDVLMTRAARSTR